MLPDRLRLISEWYPLDFTHGGGRFGAMSSRSPKWECSTRLNRKRTRYNRMNKIFKKEHWTSFWMNNHIFPMLNIATEIPGALHSCSAWYFSSQHLGCSIVATKARLVPVWMNVSSCIRHWIACQWCSEHQNDWKRCCSYLRLMAFR